VEGTEVGKIKASHALAKIAAVSNPDMAFPGERVSLKKKKRKKNILIIPLANENCQDPRAEKAVTCLLFLGVRGGEAPGQPAEHRERWPPEL